MHRGSGVCASAVRGLAGGNPVADVAGGSRVVDGTIGVRSTAQYVSLSGSIGRLPGGGAQTPRTPDPAAAPPSEKQTWAKTCVEFRIGRKPMST